MPAIDIDRVTAHDAAQRELAKPMYPKGSVPERLQEWLHELLYRIVQQGAALPGGWLTAGVLLTALILAAMAAVRVARRTIRTRREHHCRLFETGQLSAAQHRDIAEHCAAEGDWTAAIRHRLRAVARALEEGGILDPAPGRTANELARDAARRLPWLGTELSRAAGAFNDVAYGADPGTPGAYQVIVDVDDDLRRRLVTEQFVPGQHPGADARHPVS